MFTHTTFFSIVRSWYCWFEISISTFIFQSSIDHTCIVTCGQQIGNHCCLSTLSLTGQYLYGIVCGLLDGSFLRSVSIILLHGLRSCNQNWKVSGSNPTWCSTRLKDPTMLQGPWWHMGWVYKNTIINIRWVKLPPQNWPKVGCEAAK